MTATPELVALLEAVARIPADQSVSFDQPAFVALREWAQRTFPDAGSKDGLNFALSNALDRLGFAQGRPGDAMAFSTIAEAADRLSAGFLAKGAWRTHLCPLDIADEIPTLTFGPNTVRVQSMEELQAHFAPVGPQAAGLDPRFAQFPWLIVHEEFMFEHEPGRRALPFLFQNLSADFAAIEPHAHKFPATVAKALFALLLVPWEDLVSHADLNWRAFQTPWVYTVDQDIFVRPAPLPSADSLSWAPDFFTDHNERTIEYERPLSHWGQDLVEGLEQYVNDDRWREVEVALVSDLFSTPIVHFLVTAFLGAGIDEFISHLTALEAALGLREDQARQRTVSARILALLSDPGAAIAYRQVFNLRSEYVHGRLMTGISGDDRNDARRLARRVADALVRRAQAPLTDRAAFLQSLAPSRPLKTKP